ncbi:DUF5667 domain-containing protein [Streptomyces sp. DSM 44915]|uniref:DUF5667 domain-containing protein n=1 Tax=Streptomyces chisholmiae TaxID=3075540 RepID=A0ABU2JZA5_9ACTN|nr:DUF5667 domain-containing protein [Streptomyces sp. DSM 44915]MDT0270345.1 DUF5667 domain-containing protein [Streptomyces sp. DSM 44915]
MIGSVSANRRAQAFAQLLDEARPSAAPGQGDEPPHSQEPAAAAGRSAAQESDQSALLTVVERLAALPKPELAAETRAAQRAALLAAMEAPAEAGAAGQARVPQQQRRSRQQRPAGSPFGRLRPRSRLTKGLAAGGLTVGVAAGAFGGVAAASGDALPGDTLYGLKRGMEDLRLDFASGDADRGQLYLDQAATRLHEARDLLSRHLAENIPDHERLGDVRRALSNMRDDASEGHRLLTRAYEDQGSIGSIQSLSSFFEGQNATWQEVRGLLPPQLGDVKAEVTDVLDAMRADIAPLRSLLPPEPADDAAAERQNTSLGPPAAAGEIESAPASEPTPETSETGAEPRARDSAAEPTGEAEGLLEGSGLLAGVTPEPADTPAESPASTQDTGSGGEQDEADITIPPLLEDLIPNLELGVTPTEDGR